MFSRAETAIEESVVIPNGAAIPADALAIGNTSIVAIYIPAGWTAANITFDVGSGASQVPLLKEDGTLYTITTGTPDRWYFVDPRYFIGFSHVKVRSTANQGAERTLKVRVRHV